MSETIGGINVAYIKLALFVDRFRNVSTILKIKKNGVTYSLTRTAEDGSVSVNSDYLSWAFIAPTDRFNFNTLGSGTVGQLLDGIMAVCEDDPVEEWEAYARWASGPGVVSGINSIGVDMAQIRVLGFTGTPVPFSTVSSFNGILQWVKANCPAGALAMPASACRTAENEFSVALTALGAGGDELWTMTFVFRQ